MSIKTRLMTLLAAAILLASSIGVTGWIGLADSKNAITEINDVRLPSLVGLQMLSEAQTNIRLRSIETAIKELDYQATAFFEKTLADKQRAWQKAQKGWDMYLPLPQTAEEARLWKTFEQEWAAWKTVDQKITDLMRRLANPHTEDDQKVMFKQFYDLYAQQTPLFYQSEATLNQIIDLNMDIAQKEGISAHQTANNSKMIIMLVIVAGIILLLVFALWVIRVVVSSIHSIVSAVGQIVQTQQFTLRLPATQDEFNELNQGINQLVNQLDKAIAEANHVVSAIANADFNQRVTGQYVGDLNKLKEGINASANSVSFMMSELEKVMQGLNSGRFDVRMDNRVPQAFRQLVETALNSIRYVIADINQVMEKMTEGDFSGRVSASAEGELLAMKQHINTSMDNLEMAMKGIIKVVLTQADGDLTHECVGHFKGQLKQTQDALNMSARKLKSIVNQSIDASSIVNDAAGQVSQGSADLSGRVQEQAAALEQTSATMNEMSAAVQANTENAKRVAELAHRVQEQAGSGAEVMQETIAAMQSIKASSSQIADIVTLIDGIAFQTNLLALNAAVEAARAGEHGRGFAVVAGEVRALAQKAAAAAKDIKNLIHDSVQRIEVGTQLADKSGDMLMGITGSIDQVVQMIEAIADASNEQSVGIHQVHKALSDIDRVTQENASLVEQTTAAAESLSTEASHLRQNMAFFKTGDSARRQPLLLGHA